MSLLFADVRGSTTMAESMSAAEFGTLMNRFFRVASDVLVGSDAYVDNTAGDQVLEIYLPVFAGGDHAIRAIDAALGIIRATTEDDKPWVAVGVGVHTGTAFFGTVNSGGDFDDMTALGDVVNVAARLSSAASAGEVLVTAETGEATGIESRTMDTRTLKLKGKSRLTTVHVVRP